MALVPLCIPVALEVHIFSLLHALPLTFRTLVISPCFISYVGCNLAWWGRPPHDKTCPAGPLREKAGLFLLGLFSLRDHVPQLCHSWHLLAGPPPATPLTLFVPSLAGTVLVYLLWPPARVKGTFLFTMLTEGSSHRAEPWRRCRER